MNLLAFDFGGTSVKYSLWDGEKLAAPVDSFLTPATWEETKAKLIEIKEHFAKEHRLDGAACSFPGCIVQDTGVIVGYSAIKYIHHFPIRDELSELFGGIPVAMENDANCAALAEVWSGVAKEHKNVLFVVVGTGVGGGIVIDGKIVPGANLYGGEWGFMFLNYDETEGGQILSALGTAVAMAHRYCDKVNQPRGTYSGRDVFRLAKEGDEIAAYEVEKFYKYLSVGLFNLQTSFDPETIVIGGGISGSKEIIDELERRVNHLLVTNNINDFKIDLKPCLYGNDANLIGAVKNFLDRQ